MKLLVSFIKKVRQQHLVYGIATFLVFGLVIGIMGLDYLDELEMAAIPNQPSTMPLGKVELVIRVPERMLEVYSDAQLYKKYRIAVGEGKTPTPVGEWKVVWKDYNWGTGFGTRWMGLNVPWGIYGIHGTNVACVKTHEL